MTPTEIADAIDFHVEASFEEGADFVAHCQETERLWAQAREEGTVFQVHRILQERSDREMEEAFEQMGLAKGPPSEDPSP